MTEQKLTKNLVLLCVECLLFVIKFLFVKLMCISVIQTRVLLNETEQLLKCSTRELLKY